MYEVDLRQIEQEAKEFATDYTLGVTQSETWYAAYHAYKAATIKYRQSRKPTREKARLFLDHYIFGAGWSEKEKDQAANVIYTFFTSPTSQKGEVEKPCQMCNGTGLMPPNFPTKNHNTTNCPLCDGSGTEKPFPRLQYQPVEQVEEMLIQPTAKAGETPREELFDRIRKLTEQLSAANAEIEQWKAQAKRFHEQYHNEVKTVSELGDLLQKDRAEIERLKADARKIAGEALSKLVAFLYEKAIIERKAQRQEANEWIEEYINTLPVSVNQWIDVKRGSKDKKDYPEVLKEVLLLFKSGRRKVGYMNGWDTWWVRDSNGSHKIYDNGEVTHWQPLPAPPQIETENKKDQVK